MIFDRQDGVLPGRIISIDLGTGDLDSITVKINNQAVARGQLIQVGDHYGVQITDIGTGPGQKITSGS